MGGPGSGNRCPRASGKKETVEAGLTIDICPLMSKGILRPGVLHWNNLRWTYATGEKFYVNYEVDTLDPEWSFLHLSYAWKWYGSGEPQSESYRVELTTTQQHFGGLRWWLTCPLVRSGVACGRRVGKLYMPPEGRRFGCRQCLDLTYTSCQQSGKGARLFGHLATRLGCSIRDIKRILRMSRKER